MGVRTEAGAIVMALVCCAGAVTFAQTPARQKFPPEQVKRGEALYAANCESCHGVEMIGPQWAIDLATFPRDRPDRFAQSVTNGIRTMPPWGDVLKPEEIQALWAYVVAGGPPK